LIGHAVKRIRYSKERFSELGLSPEDIKIVSDLQKRPILEKSQLRDNPIRFGDDGVQPAEFDM
jgi:phenylacetate-coenzyme A ligase PaaK-like adenylate-forming protein